MTSSSRHADHRRRAGRATRCMSVASAAGLLLASASARAQQAARAIDFSGVIYPQFRMQTDDATRRANAGHAASRFDIERLYLTFRMPAGDDGSIRITTDLYTNPGSCAACYGGWALRLKYGYFNYDFLHDIGGQQGFNASARIGMVQTALIDHEQDFWPRWISQVAVERNGFFSSADVGAAGLLTLPQQRGELFVTVANGDGYTSIESDPYQDWSARLTLTPWEATGGLLKTFTVSPWTYRGRTASRFLADPGAPGTDAAKGLAKNRAGVFVGIRDRRLTAGFDWATRTETIETGATLATRNAYDNTGSLTSFFALVRPAEWLRGRAAPSRWGVLGRVDSFKPYSSTVAAGVQGTRAMNRLMIYGVWWDLNQRASVSVDVQQLTPRNGSTAPTSRVLFVHGQVSF